MSAMAKAQKGKAEAFVKEAESLLNKKSWFSSSKERNAEEAAETFEKAANAYKVGGLNQEAGDTYLKVGELYRDKLSDFSNASKAFNNAGTCYKKSSPSDAVKAYQQAVSLYTDNARITQAAKLSKEIAEIYENEEIEEDGKSHVVLAIESYEQAAELFGMEDSKSNASQCLGKIAELCSAALDPPDYLRAGKIYDDLGRRCLSSNLLKFNAKGYFLQSVLCQLANGDDVGAEQAMSKYESLDYTFGDSREGKFAAALVESFQGHDVEGFSTACFEFDRISKLNPWQTAILVKVKRSIDDGGDGSDDSDVDLT
ncbi:soluble NSF attachment protein, SNAP [Nitzschia inconspicua]|uniref:Soluble NSF attachment protein, SNAP n=1 Tax=Nitzschia inconspicua TaxID=303405 RepID=A0A9K3LME0_9STRA|nr:soluble NSF attachment protein, SNAP [Nitzschia inconspicua]